MDEWISVEDRLPEEGLSVLVGWTGSTDCAIALQNRDKWTSHWNDTCFSGDEEPPTHWQPLPEPPKALPLFYAEKVSRYCSTHLVYLRGYGRICVLTDEAKAQGLCDKLNHVWDLDLDKGST